MSNALTRYMYGLLSITTFADVHVYVASRVHLFWGKACMLHSGVPAYTVGTISVLQGPCDYYNLDGSVPA